MYPAVRNAATGPSAQRRRAASTKNHTRCAISSKLRTYCNATRNAARPWERWNKNADYFASYFPELSWVPLTNESDAQFVAPPFSLAETANQRVVSEEG